MATAQSYLPAVSGEAPRSRLLSLLRTNSRLAPTFVRVALGAVVLPHGLRNAFGWFDGFGLAGMIGFFQSLGMPPLFAVLVTASDLLGSLALIAGFATRLSAAATALVMLGAIFTVHAPNGFFMNWAGTQAGEGFEFHLLALGMAFALIVEGGGRASVDGWWARKLGRRG